MKKNKEEKKQPFKKFKSGLVEVTVWENEGTDKDKNVYKNYSLNVSRGYQDNKEVWKNTNSMRKTDIPVLMVLLKAAYTLLLNIKEE